MINYRLSALLVVLFLLAAQPLSSQAQTNLWEQDSLWNEFYKSGMVAQADGKLIKATGYFEQAVRRAEELGADDERLTWSLMKLEGVYRERGMNAEADATAGRLSRLERVADAKETVAAALALPYPARLIMQSAVPKPSAIRGDPDFVRRCNQARNRGMELFVQQDYARAESCLTEAIILLDSVEVVDPLIWPSLYNSLGAVYLSQQKGPGAEIHFLSALDLMCRHPAGVHHPQAETALNFLGFIYRELRDSARMGLIDELLADTLQQSADLENARLLSAMWRLWYGAGDYALSGARYGEALYCLSLALYAIEDLNPADLRAGVTLTALGDLHCRLEEPQQAESLLTRALEIYRESIDSTDARVATTLISLAAARHLQLRYAEAESLLVLSLDLLGGAEGDDDDPRVAIALHSLASVYQSRQDYRRAERLYWESIDQCERILGRYHHLTAGAYHDLGQMLSALGRDGEAEACFQRAVTVGQRVMRRHPDLAVMLRNYASHLQNLSREEEADSLLVRAREIEALADDPRRW